MERETVKFTTSGGHEIELKTSLTVDESDSIQDVFMDGMKVGTGPDGKPSAPSFDLSVIKKARNAAVSAVVVSIDSSKEDVLKSFLALPAKDGKEVVAEVDKVKGGLDDEKKD